MPRPLMVAAFLIALAGAAAASRTQEDDAEQLYQEGKKAFRSCAACHCVNEPALAEDEDWLKLNQVTNCISAGDLTPRVRQVLDVFLRSEQTRRPLLVDESFQPADGQACGKIQLPPMSGSAYLKAERDSIREGTPPQVRLYWTASDEGKTLTLPAGKYRVITYRFYASSDKGLWTLSVTDVNGCAELNVAKDGVIAFPFRPEVHAALSVEETGDGLAFRLAVRNSTGSTLTLSVDGNMHLPEFRIFGDAGREIYCAAFENT